VTPKKENFRNNFRNKIQKSSPAADHRHSAVEK